MGNSQLKTCNFPKQLPLSYLLPPPPSNEKKQQYLSELLESSNSIQKTPLSFTAILCPVAFSASYFFRQRRGRFNRAS